MKHRMKLTHRKTRIVCCLIAAAALLYGCGENQTASSSSSAVSSAASSEAAQTAPVSSGTAASGAAPVSSAESSVQSDGGYVLSAGSGAASGSADSPESGSPSEAEQAQPAAGAADSQPVFRSVFGSEPESGEEEQMPDTSGSKISQSEYDRIQEGMTYAQVKSLIGGEGKLQSEFGQKGSELYTVTYRWNGNGISGSYAEISFESGAVSSKIQFGLD